MSQLDTIVIRCDRPGQLGELLHAVQAQLPHDAKLRLNWITIRYMELYGLDGRLKRVNNRTVAQILAEFDPKDDAPLDWMEEATPIAGGEIDGVRWELHDAPDANAAKSDRRDGK